MSWPLPEPWELAILALAVFRIWRLFAEDTILDRPRAWLLGVPGWKPSGHETPPEGYRPELAMWLTCPWCAGFWWSLAAWGAWALWPELALFFAAPWALSGAVALIATRLAP